MATATLRNVRMRGLVSCVPKTVVSNLDFFEERKSERERLVRNIGIQQRRVCYPWQYFSDLAKTAAETLIEAVGWKKDEIDALIVVTQSPDYLIPSTAIIIQDRMKLPTTTIAYDINLGCSGYPFGIYTVGSMLSAGGLKKALLLVGDKCASTYDPLFSDCGTATALEYDPSAPPIHFDMNSDGSGHQAIMLPVGGHRRPTEIQHLIPRRDEKGDPVRDIDLILDGTAVLNFSTQRIPPALRSLADYAQAPIESIDYFVLHQANRMINETIRKKLQLPPEKFPSTLHDFGNTSSASVPLTMTARLRESMAAGPKTMLLSGFGIGLSWGSCLFQASDVVMPPLVEL
jgi:3-oxoacyl-[acyl-carrier-protein] synthase-3